MQPIRILLDLDGTVLHNAGRALFMEQFGVTLAEHESALDAMTERLGMDPAQFWDWWSRNQAEIYGRAVPLEGAAEVLRSFRSAGAHVVVVTARRPESEAVTRAWLEQFGFAVDALVFAAEDKATIAEALALNVAFEDNVQNAVSLARRMPVFLIATGRNADVDLGPGIVRVQSWHQVPQLLAELFPRTA